MNVEEQIEALAAALENASLAEYSELVATMVPPTPKKRERRPFGHYLHIDPCSRSRV